MSADTRWQLIETGKAILIATGILFGIYVLGLDFGGCPRC